VHVQGSNHFVAPGKINFDISKHRPSTLRATLTNSGKVLRSEAAIQPTKDDHGTCHAATYHADPTFDVPSASFVA
jgi:hypothetical protein